MKLWKLQDAKAKLSEMVRLSCEGPQAITVRGENTATLIHTSLYESLIGDDMSGWEALRPKNFEDFGDYEFDAPSREIKKDRDINL